MTEKRFTKYVPDSYGYTYITTIIDNEKNKQTGNTDEIIDMLNELADENEQLKQQITHLTMYKNLFREFQKQLDGVKKKSDLDHKDFEDLIELTKGHVFDDEHGWIWLPINDR